MGGTEVVQSLGCCTQLVFSQLDLSWRKEPALYAAKVAQRDLNVAVAMEPGAGRKLDTLAECSSYGLYGPFGRLRLSPCVHEAEDGAIQTAQENFLVFVFGRYVEGKRSVSLYESALQVDIGVFKLQSPGSRGHVQAALNAEKAAYDCRRGDRAGGEPSFRLVRSSLRERSGALFIVLEHVEAWTQPIVSIVAFLGLQSPGNQSVAHGDVAPVKADQQVAVDHLNFELNRPDGGGIPAV